LGRPIELPNKKEGNEPALSVFLRLPIGIATSPDDKPLGLLSHYGQGGPKSSTAKLSGIQEVFLAVTINKNWPDFKNEVLASIKGTEGKTIRNETFSAPGRGPISFETLSFTEGGDPPMNNKFYFFRNEIYRVAIVFRGPERVMNSEAAKEAIEFSLKSLSVGDAATDRTRSSAAAPPVSADYLLG
jgi:hypothetical protein